MYGLGCYISVMENKTKKERDNEMDIGVIRVFYGLFHGRTAKCSLSVFAEQCEPVEVSYLERASRFLRSGPYTVILLYYYSILYYYTILLVYHYFTIIILSYSCIVIL